MNRGSEGDVIDRASRLLAHAKVPDALPQVALDEMIAGLLDARFDVVETEAGLMLRGEADADEGGADAARPADIVRGTGLGAQRADLDPRRVHRGARGAGGGGDGAGGDGQVAAGAELVDRVLQRDDKVAVWVGRGDSLRAGSTLDLLAQALRGALEIHGDEPLAERRDKIRRGWRGTSRRASGSG